jgi:ribosome biogenesis GTPase A
MSASKSVPEGLKNQECEKGNRKNCPPIPYVPVVNEVQEAIAKGKEYSYKNKIPDKTEFSVPIWDTGTQEAFLIHVQQAKSACKRKGLFQDYDNAIEAESRAVEQAKNLRMAIAKR